MKIVRRFLLVAVSGWMAMASVAHGLTDADAGTQAATGFAHKFGVRSQGMGGAFSAVADDKGRLFGNPAAPAAAKRIEFTASQRRMIEEIVQNNIGIAIPLSDVSAAHVRSFGTFTAYFSLLDYGDFTARDAVGGAVPDFEAKEIFWTFGYSRAFGERLLLGGHWNTYRTVVDNREARGAGYDAGLIYQVVPGRWNIGLAAFNLGGDLSFGTDEEHLPTLYTGGIAFWPLSDHVLLAFDVFKPRDGFSSYRTGAEWKAAEVLVFRTGYDSGEDLGSGWTFGVGLRLRQVEIGFLPARNVNFDYSFLPADRTVREGSPSDSGVHHFSLTLLIGDQ